ncbi:undecaprenyl-diphosphatase [Hasllibacter halocynthiae]|uniref:Undecaprenyl-diphosphatase n=1 Tax=Hasllibacter halocynthiae TaxID=595589 RepID=A0A2T0X234_9RHOB|nr:undecaprenyl-diphosphate phosphatase [Hasllibacter halocynthiae]PRY92998.1 undecaprenyl-diphosphatase [Hasllibacter halocynthiae]
MPLLHLILVALIQGVTEFLPVSSSGHLILLPKLTGLDDQGVAVDVAVHVGTLGAVVLYFRQEVALALRGAGDLLSGRTRTEGARLMSGLVVGTVPVVAFGLVLFAADAEEALRSVAVIGWTMLGFGVLLWIADKWGRTEKEGVAWPLRDAAVMGLFQAVALIPGTSRSGITITGARALGWKREDAARLAMLMSIPTILAAGALLGFDALAAERDAAFWRELALAAALAFLAALGALALMMRMLRSVSFTPYVIYRVVFGAALLLWAYWPLPA